VHSVYNMFKDMSASKKIELSLDVNGDYIKQGGVLMGDEPQLKQILINFLS